jgi:hypothetical protein
MNRIMQALSKLSKLPEENAAEWLSSAESAVDFLKENVQSERLVLFASLNSVLIHAVLAPLKNLDPPDQDDLNDEFLMIDDKWAIEHSSGGGKSDEVYLSPPMHRHGKTLKGGEKLIFLRSFAGRDEIPLELSQKLIHALDLYFIPERNAYCRLDENGDLENVIEITEKRGKGWSEYTTVVTILTKDFAEYMRLSDMGMVIFFDFTRTNPRSFSGWSGEKHFEHKARDLFYHGGVMGGQGSYVNGRMIVRPTITLDEIVSAHMELRNPSKREYATFKAISLKTGERIEVSSDPNGLSNYFQHESTLPLEMSPVFFRSEVLHKYKADPEKYGLDDRSLSCRGTWSLETFDVNEAGQLHTYLRYLSRLPYNEQLYWQTFNEWPRGPLSERALTTDFKGEFYSGYDALNSLKQKIIDLDEREPPWWQPRGEELRRAVHYPVTTSGAEWANEILALDHLLNEGFLLKQLKALAAKRGIAIEPEWKVFKLLEVCLKAVGVDEDDAKEAVSKLRSLRDMRNVLKGHAAPAKKRELESQAKAKFGSFKAHFENLTSECDSALGIIMDKLTDVAA